MHVDLLVHWAFLTDVRIEIRVALTLKVKSAKEKIANTFHIAIKIISATFRTHVFLHSSKKQNMQEHYEEAKRFRR